VQLDRHGELLERGAEGGNVEVGLRDDVEGKLVILRVLKNE